MRTAPDPDTLPSWQGRTALITGAAAGLVSTSARALAGAGKPLPPSLPPL